MVGGAHRPVDAGIGVIGEMQNCVIEVRSFVGGRGCEAERSEDLFEVVIVGDAEDWGHEKLPDYKQNNECAEGQIDACPPPVAGDPSRHHGMDCQSQYVIYLHLPENGDERNR